MSDVKGADSTQEFEPVVKLDVKDTLESGEEFESVAWTARSRLYRFDNSTNEWKERGTGDCKVLQHKQTKKYRIVLRQEKTFKLVMNHYLNPDIDLEVNVGSDRAWTFPATDFAEGEASIELLAIKFQNSEIAADFKKNYDIFREANRASFTSAESKEDEEEDVWGSVVNGKKFEPLSIDTIKALWFKYDKDQSNSLDKAEVLALLKDLMITVFKTHAKALEMTEEVSAALEAKLAPVALKVFEKLDANKDGNVTWDEFQAVDDIKLISG